MESLPADVLLESFRILKSNQMVKAARVSKKWHEIINENKSLWSELVLDLNENLNEGGKDEELHVTPSILELFDRKSGNNLRTVSITLYLDNGKEESVIEVLKRSKESLRALHLVLIGDCTTEAFTELSWSFKKLVDFRIVKRHWDRQLVLFAKKEFKMKSESGSSDDGSTNRKILWIPDCQDLFQSHPNIKTNLVSLSVDQELGAKEWRGILEGSRNLKHLSMTLKGSGSNYPSIEDIHLPKLEFLRLNKVPGTYEDFPSWLKIPPSSIFSTHAVPSYPPPVSRMWLGSLLELYHLENAGSRLEEIRILGTQRFRVAQRLPPKEGAVAERLITTLENRKVNIEAVASFDDLKMKNIKTLVISFRQIPETHFGRLSDLVELIDLDKSSQVVEIEVEV